MSQVKRPMQTVGLNSMFSVRCLLLSDAILDTGSRIASQKETKITDNRG
jgi:hypothetical protein